MNVSLEVAHGIITFACTWTAITLPLTLVLLGRRMGRGR